MVSSVLSAYIVYDNVFFFSSSQKPPSPPYMVDWIGVFVIFLCGKGDLGKLAGKILRVIGNGSSTNFITLLKKSNNAGYAY